jgi:hypothetical protein
MPSYPWRLSAQFWIEKVRHLYQILDSMHAHGGFDLLCDQWSTAAKRECIAELDRLAEVLIAWKSQLQDELSSSTQPMDPIPDPGVAAKATHLRIASSGPAPRVLALRSTRRE